MNEVEFSQKAVKTVKCEPLPQTVHRHSWRSASERPGAHWVQYKNCEQNRILSSSLFLILTYFDQSAVMVTRKTKYNDRGKLINKNEYITILEQCG